MPRCFLYFSHNSSGEGNSDRESSVSILPSVAGAVVEQKAVAIAAKHTRDIEDLRVVQGLLNAGADRMFVVLSLYDCNGNVRLIVEDIIGPFFLSSRGQFTTNIDFAIGKRNLLQKLSQSIPTRLLYGRGNVFGTDVPFGKEFFIEHFYRGIDAQSLALIVEGYLVSPE